MKLKDLFKMKKEPIRLNKKTTTKEKIQNWINRHYGPLFIMGSIIVLILIVVFVINFVPGTESGLVYNNRTGVI